MEKKKLDLNGTWTLAIAEHDEVKGNAYTCAKSVRAFEKIEATVPGNFELDLVRAGKLEEPFFGENILKLQELETLHLFYFREFSLEKAGEYGLRFEGVDTFAEVYLNGKKVGDIDNAMISFEFNVCAKKGKNELFVHIRPACIEARKYALPAVSHALSTNFEALYLRKPMHAFGWDICPRAVSGGIWKGVSLLEVKKDKIDDIFAYTEALKDGKAELAFFYHLSVSGAKIREYSLVIKGRCKGREFVAKQKLWHTAGRVRAVVENPELWFPKNYGEANLYEVTATLYRGENAVDEREFSMGVRTVVLDRTSMTDEKGNGRFCFLVNGKKVFILGTNWVPVDAFHSRDRERLPEILPMLCDLNCNAVRLWGGNLYEDDYFYDFCDRNGILVWQDFSMACARYPNDEIFYEKLSKEVRFIVKRLRNHACVALWSGDNECDYSYCFNGLNPNGNRITRELIPNILHEEDFTRPYLPSSPYVDEEAYSKIWTTEVDFNAPPTDYISEDHLWGPRDYFKSPYYTNASAIFASEMGYHGCNGVSSIRKFIPEDKLWPWKDNRAWLVHSVTIDGEQGSDYSYRIALMEEQIEALFGGFVPQDLPTFALCSQISQAEAKKYFVERFRVKKWKRTGVIWWNLIDCWPQFSDAVVDYYYAKKLAYYYIKRSQEPFVIAFDEPNADGVCSVVAVNDTREEKNISYVVVEVLSGKEVRRGEVSVPSDSATVLYEQYVGKERGFYLIEWTDGEIKRKNHFVSNLQGIDLETYLKGATACGFELDCAK